MIAGIMAVVIFCGMFLMIVLDKFERQTITLISGGMVLLGVFGGIMHSIKAIEATLNLKAVIQIGFWYGKNTAPMSGINWSTIIFIAGMMIMVEGMRSAGLFRYLCLEIARKVNYHTIPILICFMLLSGFFAMFIDSITVVLFLASVTVELAKILEFNPIPLIVSEIFCANLGGAATMCGDPPNIIIGSSLGLFFFDFLNNTGLIVSLCFFITIIYFYLCFRRELRESEKKRSRGIAYPDPAEAILNKKEFSASFYLFGFIVVLLISHEKTTLSIASIGVIAAICSLLITFITAGRKKVILVLKKIDYKTLLFFIGLFVVVSGLEETGVLVLAARIVEKISRGNVYLTIAIVIWFSAIASAFVDNIPFAATMVPVIRSMAVIQGVNIEILAWTLSLGVDFGGNATPIGASANVVGISVAAKHRYYIGWRTYCKYAVPITILVTGIAMLFICERYL